MVDHSKRSSSGRVSPRKGAKMLMPVGQVRIIAGHWRGRKIPVVQAEGLRPTGDRVRETLFNWLQTAVKGSHCLDLYAGSGALGLEAASRGAASVTLVESSAPVANQLRQTMSDLGVGSKVTLSAMRAEQYLASLPGPFDLIFVDPPFGLQVHETILAKVVPDCLNPGGMVYVELPTQEASIINRFPVSLSRLKEKRFGDVTVFLLIQDN